MVICHRKAKIKVKVPAFFVVYADRSDLPMATKIKSDEWQRFLDVVKRESIKVGATSFQHLTKNG